MNTPAHPPTDSPPKVKGKVRAGAVHVAAANAAAASFAALTARLETVEQWVTPFREGVVYYLDSGRVRGALLWNTWGQVDAARALIAANGPFDAQNVRGRLPAA